MNYSKNKPAYRIIHKTKRLYGKVYHDTYVIQQKIFGIWIKCDIHFSEEDEAVQYIKKITRKPHVKRIFDRNGNELNNY